MARRKRDRQEEGEITVWPSSPPEGIAAQEDAGSVEYDELGRHFLSDAVEQGESRRPLWEEPLDEPEYDPTLGRQLLRALGLKPMRGRRSTRPPTPAEQPPAAPRFAPPALPHDLDELLVQSGVVDLTEETIREASLLDEEGEEAGEVASPTLRTDDTHSHGKRRGGQSLTSMRPPRLERSRKAK